MPDSGLKALAGPALIAGGLYLAYRVATSGSGGASPLGGGGEAASGPAGAGIGDGFGLIDPGSVFDQGFRAGLGFDVSKTGDLVQSTNRDLTSGNVPVTPPGNGGSLPDRGPGIIEAIRENFRADPVGQSSAAAFGGAAILGGAAATAGLLRGAGAAATASRGVGIGQSATTANLAPTTATRAGTAGRVLGKAGTAAYVTGGVLQAGVGLGQTAGAVYAASQGDVARAQELSSKAVQGGTRFLSLGAVNPDLNKGTVRIFGVEKQANVQDFGRGVGKISGGVVSGVKGWLGVR